MKYKDQLIATAKAMLAPGKGILAADESSGTANSRLDAVGLESTEEARRAYRQLLLTAEGMEEFISGVILYDETIRQSADDGKTFVEHLKQKGVIAGIKVDTGAKDMELHPGEKITEGLDGLRERFSEYSAMGAGFAKWRAVITIEGKKTPTLACLTANAHALARYAALAQEAGIVPMVEPEVLLDGDHSIERCYEVTARTLDILFEQLQLQGVMSEGLILKASMVLSGKEAPNRAGAQTVAQNTLRCLTEHVPKNLAGVVFLSGGQSEEEATAHLNAMNKIGGAPWPLSFSYSRAIQNPVLAIWAKGEKQKAEAAYLHRAKANSLASLGKWSQDFEQRRPY